MENRKSKEKESLLTEEEPEGRKLSKGRKEIAE